MLLRSGFAITEKNTFIYGRTYLCVPSDKDVDNEYYKENIELLKSKISDIKKAYLLFSEYKYKEAIDIYPNYPIAQVANIEMKRKELKELGWDEFKNKYIIPMLESCENTSSEAFICASDMAMRSMAWKDALEFINKTLVLKPNNPISLGQAINVYKEMAIREKDDDKKIEFLNRARNIALNLSEISLQNKFDAINQIYLIDSLLPVGE